MADRMRIVGAVVVVAAGICGSGAALALPVTFAQFQQVNAGTAPFSYSATSSSALLTTQAGGAAVNFSYLNTIGAPLPSALMGNLQAHLTLSATATAGAPYNNTAFQVAQPRGTPIDEQPFDQISASFTLDMPFNGLSNLLTIAVQSSDAGMQDQDSPNLASSDGSHAATLQFATGILSLIYTSDFLDFSNTFERDGSLGFSAVNPVGIRLDPNSPFLAGFTADAAGTFDSDPPPTTIPGIPVPEPLSLAALAAGLAALAAARRMA